jgi:hypothetical protein
MAEMVLEIKNGLPVISEKDYHRLLYTDIRAAGSERVATVDFRGYARTAEGDYYLDTLISSGILRDDEQSGMYVEIGGQAKGHGQWVLEGTSSDIKNYVLHIGIPAALQRKLGIVVKQNGDCQVEQQVLQLSSRSELEAMRAKEYTQSIELGHQNVTSMDSSLQGDPLVRQKAELIHDHIVARLLAGVSPAQLQAEVDTIEAALRHATADEVRRRLAD